jgi:hypothetical protein
LSTKDAFRSFSCTQVATTSVVWFQINAKMVERE